MEFFWITYFYSICSYDMTQWSSTFIVQWCILALQIMRFLSNAYIPYEWSNSIARVALPISHFVTEIPFVDPLTAYFITVGATFAILSIMLFATVMHYHHQWVLPIRITRQVLFWSNVIFFPTAIPHFKMVLPCISQSAMSLSQQPYYPELLCWEEGYAGYFVVSLLTLGVVITINFLNTMCFYNATIPNEIQICDLQMNARYSGATETAIVAGKIIILALATASNNSDWRLPLGAVIFLFGCGSTCHVVSVMPHWNDASMTLFIFKALILTWTGCIAMLTVPLGDSDELGLLYYLMLPVLFCMAHLILRWRFFSIASLAAHDLDSPLLVILKIRSITRCFIQWLSIFNGAYIEMSPKLRLEIERRNLLTSQLIQTATDRFPDDVNLHILSASFYMNVDINHALAYRSLELAERVGGNLHHRFRCQVIRAALDEVTVNDMSEEFKNYTEYQVEKGVAEEALSQAMVSLIQFWSLLLSAEPDIDSLIVIAEKTRYQLDQCTRHLDRMLELNRQNIPLLRLYGILCLDVLGDIGRAQELFTTAETFTKEKQDVSLTWSYTEYLKPIDVKLDIFDDVNAVVSVFVTRENVGIVEDANSAFLKIFGFVHPTEVVGKNIDLIIPEPIRSYHNRYLLDYTISRRSLLVDKTSMLMAVNSQGHLLPCAVRISVANKTFGKMIATIKPLAIPDEIAVFIDTSTLNITYSTENLVSAFGFSKRDVLAKKLTIFDIFPTLRDNNSVNQINDEVYGCLLSRDGYETRMQHAVTQQHSDICCYLRFINIYETSFAFLRCRILPPPEEKSEDAFVDIGNDANDATTRLPLASRRRFSTASFNRAKSNNVTWDLAAEKHSFSAANLTDMPRPSSAHELTSHPAPRVAQTSKNHAMLRRASDSAVSLASLSSLYGDVTCSPEPQEPITTELTGNSVSTELLCAEKREGNDVYLDFQNVSSSPVPEHVNLSCNALDLDTQNKDTHQPPTTHARDNFASHAQSPIYTPIEFNPTTFLSNYTFSNPSTHNHANANVDMPSFRSTGTPLSRLRRASCAPTITATECSQREPGKQRGCTLRRDNNTQRRLKAAIILSNSYAVQRLRWLTIISAMIMILAVVLMIVDFTLTGGNVEQTSLLIENVSLGSQRFTYGVGLAGLLHIYQLFQRYPSALQLAEVFNSIGLPASALRPRFLFAAMDFSRQLYSYSLKVDNTVTDHSRLQSLRYDHVIPMYVHDADNPGSARDENMSLKTAVIHLISLTNWSLEENKADAREDLGHFFAVSNIVSGRLVAPLTSSIRYNVDEVRATGRHMLTVTVIFFALTLASCMVTMAIFLIPLILYVEKSKSRMLSLFLAVPPQIRRSLRQKALNVYRLVEKSDEVDHRYAKLAAEDDSNVYEHIVDVDSGEKSAISVATPSTFPHNAAPSTGVTGLHQTEMHSSKHDVDTSVTKQKSVRITLQFWKRSSVIAGATRFGIFMLIIIIYYASLLILTTRTNDNVHDAVQRVYVGGLRSPKLTIILFYVIGHLFTEKNQAILENPMDPLTFIRDDYVTSARRELESLRDILSGLIAGNNMGISKENTDIEQEELLFQSLCDIDQNIFHKLYPDGLLAPYLFPMCRAVGGGIFTRGLYSTFMFVYEQIETIIQPQYSRVLRYILSGEAPGNPLLIARAKKIFAGTFDLFFNFFRHFIRYSGCVYTDKAHTFVIAFNRTRHILLGVCLVSLFMALILLVRPLTKRLGRTVRQTNAMTLILPPHIVSRIREVQKWTEHTLSKY